MCSDDALFLSVKRKAPRRRISDDDDDEDDELVLNDPHDSAQPSSSNPRPPSSSSHPPPRRSTRQRNPTNHFTITAEPSQSQHDSADDDASPNRLEQVDCLSPVDLGLPPTNPAYRLNIVVHPVAMALVSFHAHLTRTEVIGYLAGAVRTTSNSIDVSIAEAFPAQALNDRALARSGRSAYTEVEIDPESSVEVMNRITGKGLTVVGWYHSHPDASFTVQPSRVDIENQFNYQQYIFKDIPFVAAIVAPYNEDLPDHNPDFQFFCVHDEQVPVKISYSVNLLAAHGLENYEPGNVRFPIEAFVAESFNLISNYAQFAKRVRLERDWRNGVLGVDKLRSALSGVVCDLTEDGEQVGACKQQFLSSVSCIMDSVERSWKESAERDEERRERNRRGAKRKKRSRQR